MSPPMILIPMGWIPEHMGTIRMIIREKNLIRTGLTNMMKKMRTAY